jgi:hypothetical protein
LVVEVAFLPVTVVGVITITSEESEALFFAPVEVSGPATPIRDFTGDLVVVVLPLVIDSGPLVPPVPLVFEAFARVEDNKEKIKVRATINFALK